LSAIEVRDVGAARKFYKTRDEPCAAKIHQATGQVEVVPLSIVVEKLPDPKTDHNLPEAKKEENPAA